MTRIEVTSRVGADGVLHLDLPIGEEEANRDVTVTVRSASMREKSIAERMEWERFLRETGGSIPDLERPEQPAFEERKWPN